MRPLTLAAGLICLLLFACRKKDSKPPAPEKEHLLKDLVIRNLPSPYYHFDYDAAGKPTRISFSSGQADYEVVYENNRIKELRNQAQRKRDRLEYQYDETGKPLLVKLIDQNGTVTQRAFFTYNNQGKLTIIEWELKSPVVGFVVDRTLSFNYHADGNLAELRDQRYSAEGQQTEALHIDRFEQYDQGINTDGFALLHQLDKYLLLLPGIRLQLNNPRLHTRTGTGVNFTVNYSYTYNSHNYPLQRNGDILITSGQQQGQRGTLRADYVYYE